MMANGVETPRDEGTPQGGPLSPLLSNILLTDLDRELEARNLSFCRYADDLWGSQRAGLRGRETVSVNRLKLTERSQERGRAAMEPSVTVHRVSKIH